MNLLASLRAFGAAHGVSDTAEIGGALLWELGPDPVFVASEARHAVPPNVGRGLKIAANRGYDNLKYLCGADGGATGEAKRRAFWSALIEDVRPCGDRALLRAVESAAEAAAGWKVAKIGVAAGGKAALLRISSRAAKAEASDASWVLPTFRGRPLVEMPALRARWRGAEAADGGTDSDLVTGARCAAARLHPNAVGVPGTGGPTPLISFNFEAASVFGADQGMNMPASAETAALVAQAVSRIVGDGMAALFERDTILLWPDGGAADHPLLRPLAEAMGVQVRRGGRTVKWAQGDNARIWAAVEAAPAGDEPIAAVWIRGSKKRVSVLRQCALRAAALKDAALRFRDAFGGALFRQAASAPGRRGLPIVHDSEQAATAWCALTGDPPPPSLVARVAAMQDTDGGLAWSALTERKGSMITRIQRKVPSYEPTFHEGAPVHVEPPILMEHRDPAMAGVAEYAYGRVVMLIITAHRMAHRMGGVRTDPAAVRRAAMRSPSHWLPRAEAEMHRSLGKIRRTYGARWRAIEDAFLVARGELGGAWYPDSLDHEQQVVAGTGYVDQALWCGRFMAWAAVSNQKVLKAMGVVDQVDEDEDEDEAEASAVQAAS